VAGEPRASEIGFGRPDPPAGLVVLRARRYHHRRAAVARPTDGGAGTPVPAPPPARNRPAALSDADVGRAAPAPFTAHVAGGTCGCTAGFAELLDQPADHRPVARRSGLWVADGPPASLHRSSLGGYPSGACRNRYGRAAGPGPGVAVRPHVRPGVGPPGCQTRSGHVGQKDCVQPLGIRLTRIRVVAHAARQFPAGEHHSTRGTPSLRRWLAPAQRLAAQCRCGQLTPRSSAT
jgi:hypothetical protein